VETTYTPANQPATALVPVAAATPFGTVVYVQDDAARDLAWQMAITAYLDSKRGLSGSERTVRLYRRAIERLQAWLDGTPLRDVSAFHAQTYCAWMRTDRRASTLSDHLDAVDDSIVDQSAPAIDPPPGPLSPATINLHVSGLKGLYNFVRDRYTIRRPDGTTIALWAADLANPFAAVTRARVKAYNRAVYPSIEELQAVLGVINTTCLTGKRDFALLYTLAITCRRASALLNLRWGDILDANEAGDYVFQYHYKGDQRNELRRAVLPRPAYQAICAYLIADDRPPAEMQPGDYIFIALYPDRMVHLPNVAAGGEINRPISNSFANRIFKKYARRVRIGDERKPMDSAKAHLHGLRHAGARLRVQQMRDRRGYVDYDEIRELLGHSGLGVTQVYIQEVCTDPLDPGGRDAAAALLPRRRRRKSPPPPPEQLPLTADRDSE